MPEPGPGPGRWPRRHRVLAQETLLGRFAEPEWTIHAVRPVRSAINVTLDGGCDHRVAVPEEAVHRSHK